MTATTPRTFLRCAEEARSLAGGPGGGADPATGGSGGYALLGAAHAGLAVACFMGPAAVANFFFPGGCTPGRCPPWSAVRCTHLMEEEVQERHTNRPFSNSTPQLPFPPLSRRSPAPGLPVAGLGEAAGVQRGGGGRRLAGPQVPDRRRRHGLAHRPEAAAGPHGLQRR